MNALEKRTVHKQLLQHKQGLKQIKQSIDRMKLLEKEVTLKNSDLNTTMLSSVDNSTRSLESSRRLVAETEKIGGNIIVDLEHQRTALLGAKDNVKTTQSSTASARKMLRSISSRWRHTKIFLVFLNFLLMILIGTLHSLTLTTISIIVSTYSFSPSTSYTRHANLLLVDKKRTN